MSTTNSHQPRRLLVTGSAGFIGANFVRFQNANFPERFIVSLDALTYAGRREYLEGLPRASSHQFIHGDITDRALVTRLFAEHNFDTVVHFAAESHVDRSIEGPAAFVQTNLVGTFTLLDVARTHWKGSTTDARFHHVSTDEVYGSLGPNDPAFTETNPYVPSSPYSASKAGSDHLVRAYNHTYGMPVSITNCSNNYGPLQHDEKFIPTIIRSCQAGKTIPVYGDGSNVRDWLYVEDHVRGIEHVITKGAVGETYNIGGGHEVPNLQIARTICRLMDELSPKAEPHEKLIQFVKDRPGHDWRYAVDARKIHEKLGWSPSETFESGIRKTILYYLEKSGT